MSKPIGFPHFLLRVCCCVLLLLLTAELTHAQVSPAAKTIQVFGSAKVHKDQVAAAREEAIGNALTAAVDRAVVEMLPIESLIRNFQTVNDALQENTGTFVQGYQVLAEQRVRNTYRVVVQATLATAALEEQFSNAGIVTGKKAVPRILFLIAESDIEGSIPRYWWGEDLPYFIPISQTAISDILKKRGLLIIDPAGFLQAGTQGIGSNKPDLGNEEAVTIGVRLGADIVIVGRSTVERTANVMGANIRSFQATVAVRAIQTESGTEIGATTQSAVAARENDTEGITEAMTKAGVLAGETLSKQIAAAWEKGFQKPAMVKIIVEGTQNLVNFVLFRKMLNDISGVEGIKVREMRPDTSTIMANYSGTPKQLAEAMMLKTMENFGINITEVAEDHLRVEIVSKQR